MSDFRIMLSAAASRMTDNAFLHYSSFFSNLLAACIGRPVENNAAGREKGLEEFFNIFPLTTELNYELMEKNPSIYPLMEITVTINSEFVLNQ